MHSVATFRELQQDPSVRPDWNETGSLRIALTKDRAEEFSKLESVCEKAGLEAGLISLDEAKRTLSPFLISFYDGCARVRNDKLKNVLGVTLRYPDYRAGLQALRDDGFAAAPEV